MQLEEFKFHFDRLGRYFGEDKFPAEVCDLIWSECRDLSSHWFSKVITFMIGEQHCPRISEFRKAIASERERIWNEEKRKEVFSRHETKQSFGSEEVRQIIQLATDRINGKVSRPDFNSFLKLLSDTTRGSDTRSCRKCDDGVILDARRYVWKCTCGLGQARKENWPTFNENHGLRVVREELEPTEIA